MLASLCLLLGACALAKGASVEKRGLGCADGCQGYPKGTGCTGNCACIKAYGDMFKLKMNTWGDQCCPTGCGKAEGRSIEDEEKPVEKRGLGCADGCQGYPSGTGCTGNCACIKAYGNMFKLKMNTWGDQCCPTGCGKAEGRSIEEKPVEKRGLGCADGCQGYPSGTGCTGNCACIKAYGDMFKLKMNTWGDQCCPTGCGKAEGRSIEDEEKPVEKRGLGCADGCQGYPSGTGCTGNCACIKAYGDMFKLKMNTWGDQCCPTGCGKAEG